MRISIIGPPKSGRTTLALALERAYAARGHAVHLRDDNDGLDRRTEGARPPIEIHTVHRPGESVAQPGDMPAFVNEDVILSCAPRGWVMVLGRDAAASLVCCTDRTRLTALVLCALGLESAPEPAPDLFAIATKGDAWEGD